MKAEAIIPDLHDKIENSNFKKTTSILHFKSPGFLSPEMRKTEKWTDIVKSLLQWRSLARIFS